MSDGQGAKQASTDQAENDGIGADAQGKGDQSDKRKPGTPEKLARAEAQILPKNFEEAAPALVPADVFEIAAISKMLLRAPAGLLGWKAAAHVLLGAAIDVELPLFGDLAVHVLTVKERPQAHTEFDEPTHGNLLQAVLRTLPTANERWDHLASSSANCLRPERVRR